MIRNLVVDMCVFLCVSESSMDEGCTPGTSVTDQLRVAASQGRVDDVAKCLQAGATFDPDQVTVTGGGSCQLLVELKKPKPNLFQNNSL